MAITKKFLKSKPVCKVTFALSETEAKTAEVVGDFNDWGATAFAPVSYTHLTLPTTPYV